ncbi:MAG: hypothetical protein EDS66_00435 [Planctomycetota bacterium]|nr:MAG: hypothetical protein EDS66_00435 [Planctomycetota bacterium]KAB2949007.1 MAG: hypothetical protein F9K17_04535 [Phycisphaerae bacterium]MCQ3919392.1 hypothetical protein [Planctomycetota bacterium]
MVDHRRRARRTGGGQAARPGDGEPRSRAVLPARDARPDDRGPSGSGHAPSGGPDAAPPAEPHP